MSKIDEMIKQLQIKKLKADAYVAILELATSLDSSKFKAVKDEVISDLNSYVQLKIEEIEGGEELSPKKPDSAVASHFTPEDVGILTQVINQVKGKKPGVKVSANSVSLEEKKRFVKEYQHLNNKRYTVDTEEGEMRATIIGLDAVNAQINIQLDGGRRTSIDPQALLKEI